MSLLSVENLSVAFGHGDQKRLVAENISFTVEKGETVALVGESGSGKSTTALAVMQLLAASATIPQGKILFDNHDIVKRGATGLRGNRIGMVFQEPMTSLNPLHTVEKQIGEALFLHQKMTAEQARERVLNLLRLVALPEPEKRLNAYPHELSGGQRQRVMIAMALANDPDLLIADEPTTALDVTVQAQILALLKDLQKRLGMALLLITHDLSIVRRMAERVCVMQNGHIVEQGLASQIFGNPKHPYTQHLLASEPKGEAAPLSPNAKEILKATDIHVHFTIKKNFWGKTTDILRAVDNISLSIREGETVGIVGESGSGKTTLGLALLRLIDAKGEALYLGRDVMRLSRKDMRPLRRDMQIVFQDPYGSLSPRLTIADIVAEGLDIHAPHLTKTEREERVIKILEEVGLDASMRERYPHEFSGGQRQRIAIARAMILEPKFVVLDEPTSALDMSVQAQIVDLLRKLQQKHKLAYLFISHDLRVIKALANRVIVMRAGKVVEEGDAHQIFSHPEAPYTQKLLEAAFWSHSEQT